jgi:hypothetical protein
MRCGCWCQGRRIAGIVLILGTGRDGAGFHGGCFGEPALKRILEDEAFPGALPDRKNRDAKGAEALLPPHECGGYRFGHCRIANSTARLRLLGWRVR